MARRRPFHRTDRLGRQLKEVLAVVLQQESREELLRQVVVTDVEVTRDLAVARVYWYPLGTEVDLDELEAALSRASGFLRTRVGQEVRMRVTPELRFSRDASIDQGRRVEEILRDLDLSEDAPPSEEEE